MSKLLIAYFSRAGENYTPNGVARLTVGNTARAASLLEALTGADVFKIEPATPYPEGYAACTAQAKAELAADARPPLAAWPQEQVIQDCRTLLLCYPNYWGTMPMPVCSFLQRYDWQGRTILPLCTHEGSGLGRSMADLAALCPGAVLGGGLAVPGHAAAGCKEQLRLWLVQNAVPLCEGES